MAAMNGSVEAVKMLIDAKANIEAEDVRAAHVPPGRAAASARLAPLSPLARWVEGRGGERGGGGGVWRWGDVRAARRMGVCGGVGRAACGGGGGGGGAWVRCTAAAAARRRVMLRRVWCGV